jgi:hypothetical protein
LQNPIQLLALHNLWKGRVAVQMQADLVREVLAERRDLLIRTFETNNRRLPRIMTLDRSGKGLNQMFCPGLKPEGMDRLARGLFRSCLLDRTRTEHEAENAKEEAHQLAHGEAPYCLIQTAKLGDFNNPFQ